MADGIKLTEAWAAVPGPDGKMGVNDGWSATYRNQNVECDAFQQRLATLTAEKTSTLADTIFGDSIWAAKQVYRLALLKLDLKTMQSAAAQLLEVAKLQAAAAPGQQGNVPLEDATRGPGRPSTRNANANRSPAQIKRELMAIKREPDPDEPEVAIEDLDEVDEADVA